MHARFPAFHDVRRLQRCEVAQPQACGFCLAMPELPRLNDLVVLPADQAQGMPVRNWVFDRNTLGWILKAEPDQLGSFLKLCP